MALNKGDIVLVQFPFSDLSQTKLRPALVLAVSSTIDEVTVCFISSQQINNLSPDEFVVIKSDDDFSETGLKATSKIRVTRIITLERRFILRKLGKLGKKQTEKLNLITVNLTELGNCPLAKGDYNASNGQETPRMS